MNLLFLKGFNNYYNRQVKRFDTLVEYFDYTYIIKDQVNFSPNDGVSTVVTSN